MQYFYGPVYSRRLGFSLGIDIIPKKICSFDCLYCQVGKTEHLIGRRFSFGDIKTIKKELKKILKQKVRIDYITFSGSGEPTLNKDIGKIVKEIKKITKIPICVITNSSLLYRKKVRDDLKQADLVIPSLDASDSFNFDKINRPWRKNYFDLMLKGLVCFSKEYQGRLWLEIMLIKGVNDSKKSVMKMKSIVEKINPDKIHINLAVRPVPSKRGNLIPDKRKIDYCKKTLGQVAEIVSFSDDKKSKKTKIKDLKIIVNSLKRRPQTIDDLVAGLSADRKTVKTNVEKLVKNRTIYTHQKGSSIYYFVK